MGDLGQDPDTVAHLSGGVLAGSVLQLLHDMQGVIHDLMILTPVDIDDGPDAAGIMFELCIHGDFLIYKCGLIVLLGRDFTTYILWS